MSGSTLKLIALILPLGLDTLGVAMVLGIAGLSERQRLRLSLLFAGFEAGMPLIGLAIGLPLGHAIGRAADYVAAVLIATLGVYMLFVEAEEGEGERLYSMTQRGLLGAIALGVSISLDELAIGFSAGLLRLPILGMVAAIALQAFVMTQLGALIGSRVGERTRQGAERIAGGALAALGAILFIEQVTA